MRSSHMWLWMRRKSLAASIPMWIGMRRLAHVCHHWISIVWLYSRTNCRKLLGKIFMLRLDTYMRLLWVRGPLDVPSAPPFGRHKWSAMFTKRMGKKKQIKYVLLLLRGSIFTLLFLLFIVKGDDECKMWCWCDNHGPNWVKVEHDVHDKYKWKTGKEQIFKRFRVFRTERFSCRVLSMR